MCELITLKKDYNIKVSSKVTNYLNPDYIFIPIKPGAKLKVKHLDLVKKEQEVMTLANGQIIISSISGKVVGVKKCLTALNKEENCLVIENDFKERLFKRSAVRRDINNLTKQQLLKILEDKKIVTSNNNELFLADLLAKENIQTLIISEIEDEPYLVSKEFLLGTYPNEILATIAFLTKALDINDCRIVLKDIERDNIDKCNNLLGTYPNISLNLVPDLYLLGKTEFLLKKLESNEESTIVLSIYDIYNIYNIVKRNHYSTEKLITITGSAVVNPQVLNVKIGANIEKIIEEYIKLEDDYITIINGLMQGFACDYHNLIVTSELEGIIFQKKKTYYPEKCIRCGKCSEICPVKINPQYLMNHPKLLPSDKCISCGLCSYICPSYIDLRSIMKGAKNE